MSLCFKISSLKSIITLNEELQMVVDNRYFWHLGRNEIGKDKIKYFVGYKILIY